MPAAAEGLDPLIPALTDDGALFPIGKLAAHRIGQRHLAVSVFIFAGGQLLIQRRADGKYHCGGLWANTCCTHPHWGESVDACAHRRLVEEIGIATVLEARSTVDYRADVGNGLVENEHVHVFRGDLAAPIRIAGFNTSEVQETAWIAEDVLIRAVAEKPHRFTPWLRVYLGRWNELALRAAF